VSNLKPPVIKPLKVWFDEDGMLHRTFDREELIKFCQAHSDKILVSAEDGEGNGIGIIPTRAWLDYLGL
jgi:hypothetical protein